MPVSPNIANYYVGKGFIEFMKTGELTWRHLGNIPVFEFTPELEELEHNSSMEGVKSVDRTAVTAKKGTIKLTLEEWTAINVAMALLGDVDTDSAGREVIEIFSANSIGGKLRFTGTNQIGPRWQFLYNKVDFIPGSSVNPLSDEWGQIEIAGKVAAVAGSFGTATLIGLEGQPNIGDSE